MITHEPPQSWTCSDIVENTLPVSSDIVLTTTRGYLPFTLSFLKVVQHHNVDISHISHPVCTTRLFYVVSGDGWLRSPDQHIIWRYQAGDVMIVYGGSSCLLSTNSECVLYSVSDDPVMERFGVTPVTPTFQPVHSSYLQINCTTMTPLMIVTTHCVSAYTVQSPFFQQHSLLCHVCGHEYDGGVYTLMGQGLTSDGKIINPLQRPWTTGTVFVIPSGWWYVHQNETDTDRHLLVVHSLIQDIQAHHVQDTHNDTQTDMETCSSVTLDDGTTPLQSHEHSEQPYHENKDDEYWTRTSFLHRWHEKKNTHCSFRSMCTIS